MKKPARSKSPPFGVPGATLAPIGPHGPTTIEAPSGSDLGRLDREQVIDRFRRDGALLFRGFQADDARFLELARRFSAHFLIDRTPGRISQPLAPELQTATVGHGPLNFHFEYGHLPARPELLWLFCDRPASVAGETTLSDGSAVWTALEPSVQATFRARRLSFDGIIPESWWRDFFGIQTPGVEGERQLTTFLDTLAGVEHHFGSARELVVRYWVHAVGPTKFSAQEALVVNMLPGTYLLPPPPFEDGSVIDPAVLQAVDAAAASHAIHVQWQPGDVLVVDNTRWMHGRRGFRDLRRRVLTLSAYANFT